MNNSSISITPDSLVYFEWGFVKISATLVFTWVVMAILVLASILITSRLKKGPEISRWQAMLESLVSTMQAQIEEIMDGSSERFLVFLSSLFLFISLSNLLDLFPGFQPPTGSMYTTAALALCVFFAVPLFGIRSRGIKDYLKQYIKPNPVMLPFNIISELSRTLSLAIRLFGNIMSGSLIVGILLSLAPILVPVIMQILGLLIGQIQAYIFTVLAAVYIASAVGAQSKAKENKGEL